MGLDMYARVTDKPINQPVDFDTENLDSKELFYWRKHPDLHGWMEARYYEFGGAAKSFNVVPLRLTFELLDALEATVRDRLLPHTEGFFFGTSDDDDMARDLEFIELARKALKEGKSVYYTSWW